MTAQELNIAILEGSKAIGRNAYLASADYRKLYAQYKATPKAKVVVEIVNVEHFGTGFYIRTAKNAYVAQCGDGIGAGAGPLCFSTKEQAIAFCVKKGYGF